MNINEAFPSTYISSDDLRGQDVPVQIADCSMEPIKQDVGPDRDKPVLYFAGHGRGLVLNVTNAQAIASMHGDETDHWRGQWITLYPTQCPFGNKLVDCIRVRAFDPQTQLGQSGAAPVETPPPPPSSSPNPATPTQQPAATPDVLPQPEESRPASSVQF